MPNIYIVSNKNSDLKNKVNLQNITNNNIVLPLSIISPISYEVNLG